MPNATRRDRPELREGPAFKRVSSTRGSTAPCAIHARKSSITSAGNWPDGGICNICILVQDGFHKERMIGRLAAQDVPTSSSTKHGRSTIQRSSPLASPDSAEWHS